MKKYTSEMFWEEYWENLKLPKTIDKNFNQEKVISDLLLTYVPNGENMKRCIEIGCAPGRWLIFFHNELRYKVDGIEYLDVACRKTFENFQLNGINDFHLSKADFFCYETDNKYDLVSSFGFIEHFDDTETVFKKHCELVAENGLLVIGLPNLRGVNHFIQFIIDFWMPKSLRYLKTHNLRSMNITRYKKLARENNFEVKFMEYVGGFEPALFPTGYMPSSFPFSYFTAFMRLFIHIIANFFHESKNPKISSYILMILKKN